MGLITGETRAARLPLLLLEMPWASGCCCCLLQCAGTLALITAPVWIPIALFLLFIFNLMLPFIGHILLPLLGILALVTSPIWCVGATAGSVLLLCKVPTASPAPA
jgi:hypothetical protein